MNREDFIEGFNNFLENLSEEDKDEFMKMVHKKFKEADVDVPMLEAYELMRKAEEAKTKKTKIKYATQAYEVCPDCFYAYLYLISFEEDYFKAKNMLDEGLEKEKQRLAKKDFFTRECIGNFYNIDDTRTYIYGLAAKLHALIDEDKLSLAVEVAKDILRLDEEDNLGIRYILMGLYVCLEQEKNMLKLYKENKENSLAMLFPLFLLYYKLENEEKANSYLKQIHEYNPNFVKYFDGTLEEDDCPNGAFKPKSSSEVIFYMEEYGFLLRRMSSLDKYIINALGGK